jgi:predicted dienelactone hydrolase
MHIRKKCVLGLGLVALAAVASAQVKGPDPTATSIAANGPFAVSTQTVRGTGFGGGTVYSPNTAGTYGLVAFCPGFTATQSSIAVMGRRLATHGFVVVTINTNSTLDQPASRATQLLAALNAVATLDSGPVAGKVDSSRRAVTGHSMGGGGTLLALRQSTALRAGVGLTPWSSAVRNFSAIRSPAAIVGGSSDTIAPVGSHSITFYNSINQAEKLLAVIRGASHFFPQDNPANQPASKYQIAWMKRWVDGDTRYSQFLVNDARLSQFASTAPF